MSPNERQPAGEEPGTGGRIVAAPRRQAAGSIGWGHMTEGRSLDDSLMERWVREHGDDERSAERARGRVPEPTVADEAGDSSPQRRVRRMQSCHGPNMAGEDTRSELEPRHRRPDSRLCPGSTDPRGRGHQMPPLPGGERRKASVAHTRDGRPKRTEVEAAERSRSRTWFLSRPEPVVSQQNTCLRV